MLLPGLAVGCVARTRALVPCVWSRHITLGHALPGDATHYRWYGRLEPKTDVFTRSKVTHSTSTHKKQLRVLFDSEVFLIGISHEILQIRECQFVNSIYMIVCEIRIDSIDRCIRSIYSNRLIRSISITPINTFGTPENGRTGTACRTSLPLFGGECAAPELGRRNLRRSEINGHYGGTAGAAIRRASNREYACFRGLAHNFAPVSRETQ